jgi:hypothetical protein
MATMLLFYTVQNYYIVITVLAATSYYINKIQQDATVCGYLFTAKLL